MSVINNIKISDGYSIDFDGEVFDYTVKIPDGRPEIPQIIVECDGNCKVFQAVIPGGENSGTAYVVCSDKVYKVVFEKSRELGYVLQYDDYFDASSDLSPEHKGNKKLEFRSSDDAVISIDSVGIAHAVAVSDKKVTLSVCEDGKEIASLTVDKVIKAPLNIFMIIGQSNAYGYHDVPADTDHNTYFALQKSKSDKPAPGTVYCDDIGNSYDDVSYTGWYDLSAGRNGFSPALGKEWYRLTGEKTFMLQTALGSMPIEPWIPDPEYKCFGIDCYAETVKRFNYYKELLSKPDSGYKIKHVYAFWLQGESSQEYLYSNETFYWNKNGIENYPYVGDWYNTKDPRVPAGMKLMTAGEYYGRFMEMYSGFTSDVGLEYMAILPVRAMKSVSSSYSLKTEQLVDLVSSRIAQFALNFIDNGNISIVTLETEKGRTNLYPDQTAEGWGYLGCNNVHYDQIGYNALGKDSAYNLFKRFSYSSVEDATDIKIMDFDGCELAADSTVKIFLCETRQISAIVLPLFAEDNILTFTSADESVCTVDKFGLIQITQNAKLGDTTTITVSNGEISKKINVLVG